jgi:hypothetical protein
VFGTSDKKDVYVLQINNAECSLIRIHSNKVETILYENKTDLKLSVYGRSEKLWGKDNIAIIESKDNSIHFISKGQLQWTKKFSLSFPKKIVELDEGFIVKLNF